MGLPLRRCRLRQLLLLAGPPSPARLSTTGISAAARATVEASPLMVNPCRPPGSPPLADPDQIRFPGRAGSNLACRHRLYLEVRCSRARTAASAGTGRAFGDAARRRGAAAGAGAAFRLRAAAFLLRQEIPAVRGNQMTNLYHLREGVGLQKSVIRAVPLDGISAASLWLRRCAEMAWKAVQRLSSPSAQ